MELTIQTLTPIWTGGVDATADRLHATGLIGSLRWWYEVIVRGLGGWACDPTTQTCLYDPDKGLSSICDACQLFGTTGWARRFRMIVTDNTKPASSLNSWTKHNNNGLKIEAARRYRDHKGNSKIPTWYLPSIYREGELTIKILPMTTDFQTSVIEVLLNFITRYGSLAAKPQLGFGIVKFGDKSELNKESFLQTLENVINNKQYPNLPSLRNMFFAELNAPNLSYQETFNLKYDLRRLFTNMHLRHFIMGTVKDNIVAPKDKDHKEGGKLGSKIIVSNPYTDPIDNRIKIRVWGWLLDQNYGYSRETVLKLVYKHLSANGLINSSWREFNSPRDTHVLTEPFEFLKRLL